MGGSTGRTTSRLNFPLAEYQEEEAAAAAMAMASGTAEEVAAAAAAASGGGGGSEFAAAIEQDIAAGGGGGVLTDESGPSLTLTGTKRQRMGSQSGDTAAADPAAGLVAGRA